MTALAGKKALITGVTGGIGRAIALQFARQGASVVLTGRSQAKVERVFKELEQLHEAAKLPPPPASAAAAGGGGAEGEAAQQAQKHRMRCFNVRNHKGWKVLSEAYKDIDILVNCAGETQSSLLLRTREVDAEELLETNLASVIWGCKLVGKQMVARRKGGCIINVSSLLAYRAAIGTSVYAAAKAGQLGLTTALAQEFGQFGIRVNAIVPGYIDTGMTKDIPSKDELIKRIPLGRFGTPEEVAHAALFLAQNEYANNCILNLDGGLSAV